MCDLEIDAQDPIARWRNGMEAIRALELPTLASLQRVAKDGGAEPAETAVIYLEALVSAVLDTSAGGIDAETAGRCLIAEVVLFLLTGSSEIDHVRAWMRSRGLQRLEPRS